MNYQLIRGVVMFTTFKLLIRRCIYGVLVLIAGKRFVDFGVSRPIILHYAVFCFQQHNISGSHVLFSRSYGSLSGSCGDHMGITWWSRGYPVVTECALEAHRWYSTVHVWLLERQQDFCGLHEEHLLVFGQLILGRYCGPERVMLVQVFVEAVVLLVLFVA